MFLVKIREHVMSNLFQVWAKPVSILNSWSRLFPLASSHISWRNEGYRQVIDVGTSEGIATRNYSKFNALVICLVKFPALLIIS